MRLLKSHTKPRVPPFACTLAVATALMSSRANSTNQQLLIAQKSKKVVVIFPLEFFRQTYTAVGVSFVWGQLFLKALFHKKTQLEIIKLGLFLRT